MVFSRHVEVGRVALINYGASAGKICVIVDIADQNRVQVDGPRSVTGVTRQTINLKRISLTPLSVTIPLNAREKTIKKAFEKEDILAKWENSSMAKKLARREVRANLTDFDRFKLMIARKQKSRIVKKKISSMKKSQ